MPRPDEAPLVGRSAELALLSQTIDEAAKGSGRTVFIVGEGGIGKTRLATAVAERAAKRGWNVATGRAYPVETGVPYALFSDALLPVVQNMDPAALSVLTRGASADFGYLFPNLGRPSDRERGSAGGDPSEIKARLLWNFTQFLGRLSAKQPLFIVLENLQWADASSLELLHFIARQIGSQKVMLLGTYNETERDSNPVLRTTEQSLQRLGLLTSHRLAPLKEGDVDDLVHQMFGADRNATRHFSAMLYEWTRGNPFFVEETLKSLVDSGALSRKDGRWTGWEMETLRLPSTIRDVIKARIDRLSVNARTLANLAAVIGTRAPYDTLAKVSDLSEKDIVAAIDELLGQRVLVETGNVDAIYYDFTHPLLQQVIYSELGQARARLLHATIAEALESLYGDTAPAHADELALHFARAHSQALARKAVRYLHAAGRAALEKYANREAADYLAAALEHLDRDPTISDAPREDIITTLARTRQRLGEYDGAMALWERARAEAAQRGDSHALADIEHRMGLAFYWSGKYTDALARYEAGLREAEHADPTTVVRLRLAKGIVLQDLGRLREAQAEVEAALEAAAASRLNNDALLSRAHRALLLLYAWTGPLELARDHGTKALAHAAASGQRMLEWTAHWGMALLGGVSGDADAVVTHITASEQLADQMRSPLLPLWSAELSVQYFSSVGNWDAAQETAERTITLAKSLNQKMLLPRLYVWSGLIYLWRGSTERAKEYFDLAWKLAGGEKAGSLEGAGDRALDVPSIVPAHLGLASYHLEMGNPREAVRIGEAGLAIADRTGYVVWSLQWLLPMVGEAALTARDFDRAAMHLARMRKDAGRLKHRLGLAYADACEGLLTWFRDGEPRRAIPLLRSSVEQLEAIPFPPQAAKIRRRLAGALMEVGEREEGMRELRKAHDVLAKLGATAELTGTREEMRERGVRPPPKSITPGAAGLTGREIEIARMVASRKSNKEIGGALQISARTVSTHLSNIFLKLSVGSRGELADFVRQNGLLDS
ncbi:MAG TPA: BREX system ATP-binding domain-containing protein [Gemmatimonadaceae bacterium]|nr:BREX system ATP-binding domain-containing protein [Gemmatimonadaceae bacterium]